MGGFKFGKYAAAGGVVAIAFLAGGVFLNIFGLGGTSSPDPENAAEQMTGQSADQMVSNFSQTGDRVSAAAPAERGAAPSASPTVPDQAPSKVLSDAQQRIVAEAMQRQAERAQVLEERRWAAENSPLGDSIYGKVPPKKATSGAGSAAVGVGQAADSNLADSLPALAPADDFGQGVSGAGTAANVDLRQTLAPGTVIGAALMGEIRSELPGLVRAMVTADVFDSTTLRYVVIPRGSQLVGSYTNTTTTGQKRLFVYWTSVRLPDGRVFDLGRSGALDANGASGLTGRRQSGFLSSLVQATLLGIAQNAGGAQTAASDLENAAKIATGQAVGTVAERYLTEKLAAGPRFTIAAGTVVNVILEQAFTFPQGATGQDHGAVEISPQRVQPVSWPGAQSAPQQVGRAASLRPIQIMGHALDRQGSALEAQGTATIPTYDRNAYGGGWGDSDGDCRNTRQEVLAELSTVPVTYSASGCTVAHGRWPDPYTGVVFTEAQSLEIDHLVPLAWAHVHGAALWPAERKASFANDKRNLFAVEASVNKEKGAKSPLEWLPPNTAFQCEYTLRFERMVRTWGLGLNGDEASGFARVKSERCA